MSREEGLEGREMQQWRVLGKGVWEIQRGRSGLQPERLKAIRNRHCQLCVNEEGSLQCRNHFEAVLNDRSTYVKVVIQAAPVSSERLCE